MRDSRGTLYNHLPFVAYKSLTRSSRLQSGRTPASLMQRRVGEAGPAKIALADYPRQLATSESLSPQFHPRCDWRDCKEENLDRVPLTESGVAKNAYLSRWTSASDAELVGW